LSQSFLVPCLTHNGLKIWDTLAIAKYLHEINPGARCFLPTGDIVLIAAPFAEKCIRVLVICAPPCQ
jgi:glutathione S-transferase